MVTVSEESVCGGNFYFLKDIQITSESGSFLWKAQVHVKQQRATCATCEGTELTASLSLNILFHCFNLHTNRLNLFSFCFQLSVMSCNGFMVDTVETIMTPQRQKAIFFSPGHFEQITVLTWISLWLLLPQIWSNGMHFFHLQLWYHINKLG